MTSQKQHGNNTNLCQFERYLGYFICQLYATKLTTMVINNKHNQRRTRSAEIGLTTTSLLAYFKPNRSSNLYPDTLSSQDKIATTKNSRDTQ